MEAFFAGIAVKELKEGKKTARTAAPYTAETTGMEMFLPWEQGAQAGQIIQLIPVSNNILKIIEITG